MHAMKTAMSVKADSNTISCWGLTSLLQQMVLDEIKAPAIPPNAYTVLNSIHMHLGHISPAECLLNSSAIVACLFCSRRSFRISLTRSNSNQVTGKLLNRSLNRSKSSLIFAFQLLRQSSVSQSRRILRYSVMFVWYICTCSILVSISLSTTERLPSFCKCKSC